MIDLHVAVNDKHGNATNRCKGIALVAIDADGDREWLLELDADLKFQDGTKKIALGPLMFPAIKRGDLVGNVFWSVYRISEDDCAALCNVLRTHPKVSLVEGLSDVFEKWSTPEEYTASDFILV